MKIIHIILLCAIFILIELSTVIPVFKKLFKKGKGAKGTTKYTILDVNYNSFDYTKNKIGYRMNNKTVETIPLSSLPIPKDQLQKDSNYLIDTQNSDNKQSDKMVKSTMIFNKAIHESDNLNKQQFETTIKENGYTPNKNESHYRLFSNMKYYLSPIPIKSKPSSNPAIVVIGCSRIKAITTVIRNIFSLPGYQDYQIYLSLGCQDRLTKEKILPYLNSIDTVPKNSITILEYVDNKQFSKASRNQFKRIHEHYSFVLTTLFEVYHHSYVVVIEDDLNLAPTSLHFIKQVIPIVEADPSLICLSLFNDNANGEDYDPTVLHRSSLFPNLGVVFDRKGYDMMWKNVNLTVSTDGWDHWLRSKALELNVECVYPSLPRVRHIIYSEGTTVTKKKNAAIAKIPWYTDPTPVDLGDLSYLLQPNYDKSLISAIVPSAYVTTVINNMQYAATDVYTGNNVNITYNKEVSWEKYKTDLTLKTYRYVTANLITRKKKNELMKRHFYQLFFLVNDETYTITARFYKLSRTKRGFHKGILHTIINKTHVFMIDRREAWYVLPIQDQIQYAPHNIVLTSELGESCNEVCEKYSKNQTNGHYVCNDIQLHFINNCKFLRKYYPCENGCLHEIGQDLPAYVNDTENENKGTCLFSNDVQPICFFAMKATQRLCVCTLENEVVNYKIRTPILTDTRKQMKKMKQIYKNRIKKA